MFAKLATSPPNKTYFQLPFRTSCTRISYCIFNWTFQMIILCLAWLPNMHFLYVQDFSTLFLSVAGIYYWPLYQLHQKLICRS